jgi:hypothetical protein
MSTQSWTCRICFEEEFHREKVLSPCRCTAESQWVHRTCLHTWRHGTVTTNQASHCPTCLGPYQTRCTNCKTLWEEMKPVLSHVTSSSSSSSTEPCIPCKTAIVLLSKAPPLPPSRRSTVSAWLESYALHMFAGWAVVSIFLPWYIALMIYGLRYMWMKWIRAHSVVNRVQCSLFHTTFCVRTYVYLVLSQAQWIVNKYHSDSMITCIYLFVCATGSTTVLFQEVCAWIHTMLHGWRSMCEDPKSITMNEEEDEEDEDANHRRMTQFVMDEVLFRKQHRRVIFTLSSITWITVTFQAFWSWTNEHTSIADHELVYTSTCLQIFTYLFLLWIRPTFKLVYTWLDQARQSRDRAIRYLQSEQMEVVDRSQPMYTIHQFSRIRVRGDAPPRRNTSTQGASRTKSTMHAK